MRRCASFMGISTPSPRPATPFTLTDQTRSAGVGAIATAACRGAHVLQRAVQRHLPRFGLGDRAGRCRPREAGGRRRVRHGQHRPGCARFVRGCARGERDRARQHCRIGIWSRGRSPPSTGCGRPTASRSRSTPRPAVVAHNDVMDFIDPRGSVRYRATPFANESSNGTFSLAASSEARWAQGIATYAGRLVGP